jgi:outer membrane beta-barrel protein
LNRVELAPSAGFTVNDPYVFRPALGVALNYWWTNVLAVGVNFNWYQGLGNARNGGQDLNFFVRRSTRLAVPITEWQLGANLNFTYVPLYGKFSMFNEFIFQWDAYIVGGVGLMRTRPIPVVDPTVREFEYGNRIAFNAGIGIRIFLSRFLSIYTEIRDYLYLEKLENREVALGADRLDPNTWLSGNELTNNVTVHVGLTVFFPFTFDYRLPK